MDRNEAIEISFGAKDSELKGWEYTIPEGMEAEIKNGKIIVREKESEDERIRKALITKFTKEINDGAKYEIHNVSVERILAWLEKQGEQKVPVLNFKAKDWYVSKVDGKIHNIYHSVDKVEPKFKVGDWVVYNDDICQIVKREEGCNKLVTNFGIEKELVNERNLSTARLWTIEDAKDGDVLAGYETIVLFKEIEDLYIKCYCTCHLGHKHTVWVDTHQDKSAYHPATKEQRELLFREMKIAGYEWDAEKKELRKIEQNPADKAEPKFEIGDLITNGILVGKIDEIHELGYHANFGKYYADVPDIEKWHKWTIQDAKDGDVIVNGSNVFIFFHCSSTRAMGYCHINLDDRRFYDDKGKNECFGLIDTVFTPASKEQRDLLFQKMKEAGYEWDAEKKELRKIEQKHTPKHKVGDTIYYNSFGELKSMIIANVVTDSTDNPMYEDKEGNAVFEKDIIEQNPAWSKDDEYYYGIIQCVLNNKCVGKADKKNAINWFKDLKIRVQSQSKSEWSEEDEEFFENALWHISYSISNRRTTNCHCDTTDWLKGVKERFKALKERCVWKPTARQLTTLSRAIELRSLDESDCTILTTLWNDLNKLKG